MAGLLQLAHEAAELAGVSKLCRRTFTLPVEDVPRPGLPRVAICPAQRHAIKKPSKLTDRWKVLLARWKCEMQCLEGPMLMYSTAVAESVHHLRLVCSVLQQTLRGRNGRPNAAVDLWRKAEGHC